MKFAFLHDKSFEITHSSVFIPSVGPRHDVVINVVPFCAWTFCFAIIGIRLRSEYDAGTN